MSEELRKLDALEQNIRESRAVMNELSIRGVSLGMSKKKIDEEVREALVSHMEKVIEKKLQKMIR